MRGMGQQNQSAQWMRLTKAADFLGVHYTTLRRWSDAGDIPCFKTPGGRRRYKKEDLEVFLNRRSEGIPQAIQLISGEDAQPEIIREIRQLNMKGESWYGQISPEIQAQMAHNGRKLIGSLMQYASRTGGGEKYLQQGIGLGRSYGELCRKADLTVAQTMQAFINIRYSIVDSLCEAGMVVQDSGEDTWNIFRRVNFYLDSIMLAVLESFSIVASLPPGAV